MLLNRTCRCVAVLSSFGALMATTATFGTELTPDDRAWRPGFSYTGEMWRAARGGLVTGSSYLDNLAGGARWALKEQGERSNPLSLRERARVRGRR